WVKRCSISLAADSGNRCEASLSGSDELSVGSQREQCGYSVELRTEGWGFESLRARQQGPAPASESHQPGSSRGSSFEEPQRSSFSMGHSGAAAQPVAPIALSPAAGMLERMGGKDAQVS